ncbi:MAG: cytochrome d ubiquinol oxidase subunit II [Deltaproteobacteria bacterium]|nr:cytochrome d ubiquinol oxidase subunit II [Deltaproteobacteria bacterium]
MLFEADLDLPLVFGALIGIALLVYALTGGADFGGGVWDLLASGPRKERQRTLIAHAIGPIWEANHVWMILVVVLLFVAFPVGFAALMTALHIPVVLMLIGITLRGAAFVFRAYGPTTSRWRRWGVVFAASSVVTPILLGVILGAVTSGSLRLDEKQHVITDFFSEWCAPFPWALGFMMLSLFAYLAAVYLTIESDEPELRADFSRRALFANAAFGLSAAVAALTAKTGAPHLFAILAGTPRAWLMQGVTAIVALSAMAGLIYGRFRLVRVLAIVQTTLVWSAWMVAQNGWLLVNSLALDHAASPATFLAPALIALALGSLALVPAFVFLFWVFKANPTGEPRRTR